MRIPRLPASRSKLYAIIAWVGTGVFGIVVVLNVVLIVLALGGG